MARVYFPLVPEEASRIIFRDARVIALRALPASLLPTTWRRLRKSAGI
jgi:hypothetical protein